MISKLPDALKKLSKDLAELPSIGPRQATRLAFYLISQGQETIRSLAKDIDDLGKIKICERCFFVHQNPSTGSGQVSLCDICKSPARRKDVIAVVEKETDLMSLENTGRFTGRYLILGPIPKTGLLEDWQKLRLQSLKSFIEKELNGPSTSSGRGKASEIILALNPTSVGDFHASLLTKELGTLTKKISRLGRGLPTGGEIEFADDETLGSAIEKRS
ncbi:MAG: toprim domain-containing protein [Candidatus Liptonbacteria bacterium]|nr:toprim domain-containing protein [Candidatus Liptonbacteria bacterium]